MLRVFALTLSITRTFYDWYIRLEKSIHIQGILGGHLFDRFLDLINGITIPFIDPRGVENFLQWAPSESQLKKSQEFRATYSHAFTK